MSKVSLAVARHERARQKVNEMQRLRKDLVSMCEKEIPNHRLPLHKHHEARDNCLVTAYSNHSDICKDNGEWYSFSEILEEGFEDGDYCKYCRDSYKVKIGKLADAKKEFGIAKRAISFIGKSLIKNGE